MARQTDLHTEVANTTTWLVPRNESDPEGEDLRAMVAGHIVGLVRDKLQIALPPEQFEAVKSIFEQETKS